MQVASKTGLLWQCYDGRTSTEEFDDSSGIQIFSRIGFKHPDTNEAVFPSKGMRGLCLGVHGWVPVRVVEDDGVGAREVHADAAGARGKDEDEELGVGVEALHEDLALLGLRCAVQAQVAVAVQVQKHLLCNARHHRQPIVVLMQTDAIWHVPLIEFCSARNQKLFHLECVSGSVSVSAPLCTTSAHCKGSNSSASVGCSRLMRCER